MTTAEINRAIYNIAKSVHDKSLSKTQGIEALVKDLNMNRGSAQIVVVQVFPKLFDGERFTRTLGVNLFDSFLNYIEEDFGRDRLEVALSALKMHIEYIKGKGDPKIKLRKIYDRYKRNLVLQGTSPIDEKEQSEIAAHFTKVKTREELLNELQKTQVIDDEVVSVNHKIYKRNNKMIALIKVLRNFECQICGASILKRNGSKYIEAAHINPKHNKGKETADNIILLCPNHHKEFDLGKLEVFVHSVNEIQFMLNEKKYKIELSIS